MASTAASNNDTALAELLTALASGVRSSSRLPVADDFEFLSALPEVSESLQGAQSAWLQVVQEVLQNVNPETSTPSHARDYNYADLEDPLLWEDCVDACDYLLEHAEAHLTQDPSSRDHLQQLSRHGQSQLARMTQMTADIPKPQLAWTTHNYMPRNERTRVFVPSMTTKPFAVQALDLTLRSGHGLDTRYGSLRTVVVSPSIIGMCDYCYDFVWKWRLVYAWSCLVPFSHSLLYLYSTLTSRSACLQP